MDSEDRQALEQWSCCHQETCGRLWRYPDHKSDDLFSLAKYFHYYDTSDSKEEYDNFIQATTGDIQTTFASLSDYAETEINLFESKVKKISSSENKQLNNIHSLSSKLQEGAHAAQ